MAGGVKNPWRKFVGDLMEKARAIPCAGPTRPIASKCDLAQMEAWIMARRCGKTMASFAQLYGSTPKPLLTAYQAGRLAGQRFEAMILDEVSKMPVPGSLEAELLAVTAELRVAMTVILWTPVHKNWEGRIGTLQVRGLPQTGDVWSMLASPRGKGEVYYLIQREKARLFGLKWRHRWEYRVLFGAEKEFVAGGLKTEQEAQARALEHLRGEIRAGRA